jgi:hypothetical protein
MLQCSSWHRLAAEAETLRKFQILILFGSLILFCNLQTNEGPWIFAHEAYRDGFSLIFILVHKLLGPR